MNLENAEFRLSGFSHVGFGSALEALTELARSYRLWRVVVWGRDGEPKATIFADAPSDARLEELREPSLSEARTVSGEYRIEEEWPASRVTVSRAADGSCTIDGHLPLSATLARNSSLAPGEALERFAELVLLTSIALKTVVLSVGPEYSDECVGPRAVLAPEILIVLAESKAASVVDELRSAGAVVEAPREGQVRVWLQEPRKLAASCVPTAAVHEIIERELLSLT